MTPTQKSRAETWWAEDSKLLDASRVRSCLPEYENDIEVAKREISELRVLLTIETREHAAALETAQAERDRYCKQSENYSLELVETQQDLDKLRAELLTTKEASSKLADENAALKAKLELAVEVLNKALGKFNAIIDDQDLGKAQPGAQLMRGALERIESGEREKR